MLKKTLMIGVLMIAMIMTQQHTFAKEQPNIDVHITSPNQVKDYPGKETNIVAQVTNNTNKSIKDVMVYITMADWGKHSTVNLEDYSANNPVLVKELKPGEQKKVILPIRFVYTSHYYLYVTVTSTKSLDIYSSKGIPINIMGNTKINPTIVQIGSIGTPLIILLILGSNILYRRKRKKV